MQPGSSTEKLRGLYLITDERADLVRRAAATLPWASALQFRAKNLSRQEKLQTGRELAALCKSAGVLFIVNDDPDLARELDADGVHLGQDDGDVASARQILGSSRIIGVSTHTPEEAAAAEAGGADYIGFGAMFPTGSKAVLHLPGVAGLAETRKAVSLPIVAIGGISRDNATKVIDAGADCLAVISAVMSHPEPAVAVAELKILFNRKKPRPRGVVLTVAGSDSGGGAGIQADLKTIALLGSYGASAITALTAQNTLGVSGIHPAPPDFVEAQLNAVLADIPVDVVKTGMLFSAEIIRVVAERLAFFRQRMLIVDPVMIAKGGANLIDGEAVAVMKEMLLPMTYLLTPNIPEAEALTGLKIVSLDDMMAAAVALRLTGTHNVLIKGGHGGGAEATDLLYDGKEFSRFSSPRTASANTHGTGCTLSSAIATFLGQGNPLPEAVGKAKDFITAAIRLAGPLGKGHGPVNHYLAAQEISLKEF